jgi:hypothetical protein
MLNEGGGGGVEALTTAPAERAFRAFFLASISANSALSVAVRAEMSSNDSSFGFGLVFVFAAFNRSI